MGDFSVFVDGSIKLFSITIIVPFISIKSILKFELGHSVTAFGITLDDDWVPFLWLSCWNLDPIAKRSETIRTPSSTKIATCFIKLIVFISFIVHRWKFNWETSSNSFNFFYIILLLSFTVSTIIFPGIHSHIINTYSYIISVSIILKSDPVLSKLSINFHYHCGLTISIRDNLHHFDAIE